MTMEQRFAAYEKQRNGLVTEKQLRRIKKKMNREWRKMGCSLHV